MHGNGVFVKINGPKKKEDGSMENTYKILTDIIDIIIKNIVNRLISQSYSF